MKAPRRFERYIADITNQDIPLKSNKYNKSRNTILKL